MDALAAFGDAHITVHEVFHLNACALAEEAELREGHFPAHHDAGDAILLQPFNGVLVVGVHHYRGMERDGEPHFVNQLQHCKILHQDGIRADFLQVGQIFAQGRNFLVADKVVQSDVKMYAMGMGVLDGPFKGCVIKVEISLVHAHIEVFAAKVDRISS